MNPTIFIARPAVVTQDHEHSFNEWVVSLNAAGFRVDRLLRHEYMTNPWALLNRRLAEADGMLALGFAQLAIAEGVSRPGTVEAAPTSGSWTSPWLQIEVGFALGSGIPVLAVPQHGVLEGVFDPSAATGPLFSPLRPTAETQATPRDWVIAVQDRFRRRTTSTHGEPDRLGRPASTEATPGAS